MAIWQYRAELIPESWFTKEFGSVPSELKDYSITEDSSKDTRYNPHYWGESDLPEDIVQQVGEILEPTRSWSTNALMFGDAESTDISIWYDKAVINSIYFRWDLRQPKIEVLAQITSLANKLSAYIVSQDRVTVVEPALKAVLNDIKKSDAYRFCSDPKEFLRKLAEKHDFQ